MKRFTRPLGLAAVFALVLSTLASGQVPATGKSTLTINGRKQQIHCFPAKDPRLNRRVLYAPGDGGWRGWAIPVAETMATWGYDVCGLDTKAYLKGFTGGTSLTGTEVTNDLRAMAEWMTQGSGERVTLVGWSAGAGLDVLAAAEDSGKSAFSGLVVFGLGDEHLIAQYLPRMTPLPFYMIQSSHDEYTPRDEGNRLFAAARDPKRFVLVPAKNHRFGGSQDEFFRTLREGLRWIDGLEPSSPLHAHAQRCAGAGTAATLEGVLCLRIPASDRPGASGIALAPSTGGGKDSK